TEATSVAYSSCFSAFVLGAVSLSRILNNKKTVCTRELQNRIHVRRLPEKMNRNDCFGSFREILLQFGWIHRERSFVHVDEHRPSFAIRNCLARCDEGVRDRDDFVALSNSKRQKREPKGVRAVAHADGVIRAAVGREFFFELFHERPPRKSAALDYVANSALEFVHHGS